MDDRTSAELLDPASAHQLVPARRPPIASAVHCVASDVVGNEVVHLPRWAAAATGGPDALPSGRWRRPAAGCADLLSRLPSLEDEPGEAGSPAPDLMEPGLDGAARAHLVSGHDRDVRTGPGRP